MTIPLNLAINPLSFGQVSLCILRELRKREHDIILAPISGKMDLASEAEDKDFASWLTNANERFLGEHNRDNKIFKLWHLSGSLESLSKDQVLFSFYELDRPTLQEINIVKNNHKVLFSSKQTVEMFKAVGCDNVHYVPLGFDSHSFKETTVKYFDDDRIVFSLLGKFEKRKHHAKVIKAWLNRYGNNKKYALHCALWNPFFSQEQNSALVSQILEGKRYFNVNFMGYMQKNEQYNDFLNASNIALAMSGGEGWGLPEFHSVALGKHAVVLDCSAYKGWANKENSVLVQPSGKIPVYDGVFFKPNEPFNQGQIFDFNETSFIGACEKAIERVNKNRVNKAGKKLKEKFTYSKTVDVILDHMK